jgi:hypothetical protein
LCRPVSITRATTCTPPLMLAVGATSSVSRSGDKRARSAIQAATRSSGSVRVSSTSTPCEADSVYPSLANSSFSTRACARNGPEPMAK